MPWMPGMIATTRSDEQKKKKDEQPRMTHHDESRKKGDVLVRTSSYRTGNTFEE